MDDQPQRDPILSDLAHEPDMRGLLELFVSELPEKLDAIRRAWDDADADTIRRIAHQLKGASGGYGFGTIGSAAARLEAALRAESADLNRAQTELDDLIDLCRRAQA